MGRVGGLPRAWACQGPSGGKRGMGWLGFGGCGVEVKGLGFGGN